MKQEKQQFYLTTCNACPALLPGIRRGFFFSFSLLSVGLSKPLFVGEGAVFEDGDDCSPSTFDLCFFRGGGSSVAASPSFSARRAFARLTALAASVARILAILACFLTERFEGTAGDAEAGVLCSGTNFHALLSSSALSVCFWKWAKRRACACPGHFVRSDHSDAFEDFCGTEDTSVYLWIVSDEIDWIL